MAGFGLSVVPVRAIVGTVELSRDEKLMAIGYVEGVNDCLDTVVSLLEEIRPYLGDDSTWLADFLASHLPGMKFPADRL